MGGSEVPLDSGFRGEDGTHASKGEDGVDGLLPATTDHELAQLGLVKGDHGVTLPARQPPVLQALAGTHALPVPQEKEGRRVSEREREDDGKRRGRGSQERERIREERIIFLSLSFCLSPLLVHLYLLLSRADPRCTRARHCSER